MLLDKILTAIFGSQNDRDVKALKPILEAVNAQEDWAKSLPPESFPEQTKRFKQELAAGKTLDDILPQAFALAREAASRVRNERAFDVQIMGAINLHKGRITEMKTGEGKTLVAVIAAYLNSLTGKGVHVVTVNDYLAERDADTMRPVFEYLGCTVGSILSNMDNETRKVSYNCDITYGTNNEFGFDYLRDNMKIDLKDKVQRGFSYCIVDEIDSILIDEARTPLIISGAGEDDTYKYHEVDKYVGELKEVQKDPKTGEYPDETMMTPEERAKIEGDYTIDEKSKRVSFTDKGMLHINDILHKHNLITGSLEDEENFEYTHYFTQALRAHLLFHNDVDYLVRDGKVEIIDEFTGRVLEGRRYSDGLHQAIEAKEHIRIAQRNRTMATITFQNFFRMYDKLSGMTGTAATEAVEFNKIYNLDVVAIPTNLPVARIDENDVVYLNEKEKWEAIADEIKTAHEKGQPVLVGTVSVEKSEHLSAILTRKGIRHEVLNAKNHAREALIIAKARAKGSVTIATNMAGRGTDIKLSDEVRKLGGLCVVGTERHESRRIDNQLRGRSGRQGDPGYTQFFVSMKDDLMVRFGSDRIGEMMSTMGLGDQAIQSKTFTKSIGTAQKRVEGNNFDIRKQLLQYDDVMNNQREIIYDKRNKILDDPSIHEMVLSTFRHHIEDLVNSHIAPEGYLTEHDFDEIVNFANENLLKKDIKVSDINNLTPEEVIDKLSKTVIEEYEDKIKEIPPEITNEFEKVVTLQVLDNYWMEHINTMSHLREGIHLRGYAQEDPLRAYTMEGFDLFDAMLQKIDKDVSIFLLKAEVRQNIERKAPSKKQITNEKEEGVKKTPKKSQKIGRNDPCPCGSGKKYKQYCGK